MNGVRAIVYSTLCVMASIRVFLRLTAAREMEVVMAGEIEYQQ